MAPSIWHPTIIFPLAILLRVGLLIYGRWQDTHSPFKYTDIDYLVFTDAARYVAASRSPYDRATYRYTPLLAWILLPTTWPGGWWFEFGKALFAAGDVVTGWMIFVILRRHYGMDVQRAGKFAGVLWLVNPMVANISTRGSSEGLLAVLVVALLWAGLERRVFVAGGLLGFGVHFKIYPFVYAVGLGWWFGERGRSVWEEVRDPLGLVTRDRVKLVGASLATFMAFNGVMYLCYGMPFVEHSYTYHLTRIDHRHNFSVYNTMLHLSSLAGGDGGFRVESLAFLPQLFLSVVAIPALLAKTDLASMMLAQTFAFVTFNKVCTSQYFLWYMVFLPFYLPFSTLLKKPRTGITALVLWVAGQAFWLQQGYELEFNGQSTFVPGLWFASVVFFLVNCWILGIVVDDVKSWRRDGASVEPADSKKDR
ncbi:glycosyltransferase family 50 protein [Zasmidium cellare ATCC 36951]|uniref:GPI mannosyltransferase 1 n=1 Tax=Zasmidium cellare ATCC 36951 TaxID=1080233 RepID=A0A6A6CYB1_ZASCE|nr:glycosyltransferase family 50 protein [Zasmidium cellare ATCC 36951]KAF2172035.1 glycosyltransferase family 50 protein [Zasmidium cellare ATCC 36951]